MFCVINSSIVRWPLTKLLWKIGKAKITQDFQGVDMFYSMAIRASVMKWLESDASEKVNVCCCQFPNCSDERLPIHGPQRIVCLLWGDCHSPPTSFCGGYKASSQTVRHTAHMYWCFPTPRPFPSRMPRWLWIGQFRISSRLASLDTSDWQELATESDKTPSDRESQFHLLFSNLAVKSRSWSWSYCLMLLQYFQTFQTFITKHVITFCWNLINQK